MFKDAEYMFQDAENHICIICSLTEAYSMKSLLVPTFLTQCIGRFSRGYAQYGHISDKNKTFIPFNFFKKSDMSQAYYNSKNIFIHFIICNVAKEKT